MKTAIITGASSGIGAEFAKILSENHNLILVSRDEKKLNKIKLECNKKSKIKTIPLDLTIEKNIEKLFEIIDKNKLNPNILINNAGLGDYGVFEKSNLGKQQNMIDLNIKTLVNITHKFLKNRNKKIKNYILNMGSVASFVPGPYMSVYFASKAFVLSFSEALSEELKNENVQICVYCPGPTKSDFAKNAGLKFPENIPQANEIAQIGINSLFNNKTITVPQCSNKYLAFILPRLFPRKSVRKKMELRRRPKD